METKLQELRFEELIFSVHRTELLNCHAIPNSSTYIISITGAEAFEGFWDSLVPIILIHVFCIGYIFINTMHCIVRSRNEMDFILMLRLYEKLKL